MDWAGRTNPPAPSLLRYNPTGFFAWGYEKDQVFRPKLGVWLTSCTNIQCSCLCDTPDDGKHATWNRVPFGQSMSYKWRSLCDVLNLIICSSKQTDTILFISYTLYFVCTCNVANKFWSVCTSNCLSRVVLKDRMSYRVFKHKPKGRRNDGRPRRRWTDEAGIGYGPRPRRKWNQQTGPREAVLLVYLLLNGTFFPTK
jgi:hypothetical protein